MNVIQILRFYFGLIRNVILIYNDPTKKLSFSKYLQKKNNFGYQISVEIMTAKPAQRASVYLSIKKKTGIKL